MAARRLGSGFLLLVDPERRLRAESHRRADPSEGHAGGCKKASGSVVSQQVGALALGRVRLIWIKPSAREGD